MKTTAELIQENIARFEVACNRLDKKIITRDELLENRKQSLEAHDRIINSLRKQLNYVKS